MFSTFLVDTFRTATMREVSDRVKTFTDPETEWNPFLMLDSDYHEKFMATELGPEHFKNKDTIENMFGEFIPETLFNFNADMAALVKPVWSGRVTEENPKTDHFHQGILLVMAYPRQIESWVAPIIRVPNKEPAIGKFTYYKMEYDDTGSWIKTAFQRILDGPRDAPKLLTEGGEEDTVDMPLD